MKSERLKLTVLLAILLLTTIFPITFNLINKYSQKETHISIINKPKLSAETEWVPNGTVICDNPSTQHSPHICEDGSGGVIITWWDNRVASDIYAQRIDSNGNILWTPNGTAIRTQATISPAITIDICSDGYGGAIIAWSEYTDLESGYNVFTQKINANGITQWNPNGTAICTAEGHQSDVTICGDGYGGAILTWLDLRNGNEDIYTQRINETGDIQWTTNGTAICTETNEQDLIQIISDQHGGAIITWKANNDIYVQRIDYYGVTQWDANGTIICSAASLQDKPQLCSDGDGGAIVTWEDYRGVADSIFAQNIDSSGVVKWTPDGVNVSNNGYYDAITPQICSDSVNGSIIVWAEYRGYPSFSWDIHAQRLNMLGILQWGFTGIIVSGAEEDQTEPQICSDGYGGALIIWKDERNGNIDIYAQKIGSEPINYTYNGIVCNEESDQYNTELCSDGLGGAIITWADDRRTSADIYALRVDDIPYSNHPEDFETYSDGSEIINWILFDDTTGGKYRVIANDTAGNTYVWLDWTSWDHNIPLDIPLNRTELGFFSYKIEYYDELNQYGIPDTVIVTIKAPPSEKAIPLGHYYLLFIIFGVVAIIIIKKSQFQQ